MYKTPNRVPKVIKTSKSIEKPLDKKSALCYNMQAVCECDRKATAGAHITAKIKARKKLKKVFKKLLTKALRCAIITRSREKRDVERGKPRKIIDN